MAANASKSQIPPPEVLERIDGKLRAIRAATVMLVVVALLATAYFARDFLLPVVLAFLLALTLSPIVRYLQRRNIPAGLTALLLVGAIVAFVASGIFFLSGPVKHWLEIAPEIGEQLSSKLASLRSPVEAAVQASQQVEKITGKQFVSKRPESRHSAARPFVARSGHVRQHHNHRRRHRCAFVVSAIFGNVVLREDDRHSSDLER